ncbi:MAG: RES family NAD+ phosphorylase, partial [Gemmatimonadetes bacterium]|nr:RES family NAD+ phosphorylase [Gemmatimonadota bacterium]
MFEDIERFQTPDAKPCIRTISPSDAESTLYRARRIFGTSMILQVIDAPAFVMGPPPNHLATAGRMNPAGISIFYGAFDAETCLAEIRLPVGATAFTASFQLVRPITVLDFTVLDNAVHRVSLLDPAFDHVSEQWAFLSHFHDEIGHPILEHEEVLEFIPTQV